MQAAGQIRNPRSIAEYALELAKTGTRVLPGSEGTFWVRYGSGVMVRVPQCHLAPPAAEEVSDVLWRGPAAVASYLVEPDEHDPANCWLYICVDQSYDLDKLTKPARRDARRAQRSLRMAFIDSPTLMSHGLAAFRDTRTRVGLSDGTQYRFQRRYGRFLRNPAHYVLGAWKEDALVAFMPLITMGDVVQIEGCFSTDAHRRLCPNNGLVHHVLEHFLVQRRFRVVDYGVSSVQESSNVGLHTYKKRIGFEARPVRRLFVLHPLLRPFANRLMLSILNAALYFRPADRRLRKAGGVLGLMLGENGNARNGETNCEQ